MRVACPVRRRLVGLNPCLPSRDNPGVLSDVLSILRNGATETDLAGDRVAAVGGEAVLVKAGENPVQGVRATVRVRADQFGCKARQVRSTSAGVGSSRRGDARDRTCDRVRRSAQTADGEKLNHEMPARACQ